MQNRYVADIGDFGKYGLLRAVVRDDLSLGVVSYLNPDEEKNSDGGFITYLKKGKESGFRECDPELYDVLRGLLSREKRNVLCVQQSGILKSSTLFYDAPLKFVSPTLAKRKEHRDQWCREALCTTEQAQIVFFDPDNGLPGKTAKPYSKNGPKYVFPEELLPYAQRGQSLIVYQHQNRTCALADQIEAGQRRLMHLAAGRSVWALSFHRMRVRIYFVLASVHLENILHNRLCEFAEGPWKGHFRFHS